MARPKKPLISRDAAARAALEAIDAEGIENCSVGAVARRLGVKAPSLYYHFKDKAELLAEVARSILLKIPMEFDDNGSWETQTIELCKSTRRALLAHPNAAPLILEFFPRHLLLDAYEWAVAGYPNTRSVHMAILEGIEKITFGSALFAAAAKSRGQHAMPMVDKLAYPQLAASIEASEHDDEGAFEEALKMFMAGVRVRTSSRAQ